MALPNIAALVYLAEIQHLRALSQMDRVVAETWTHAIASGLAHGYLEEGSDAYEHLMTMCYDSHEHVALLAQAMGRPLPVATRRPPSAATARGASECSHAIVPSRHAPA